MVFYSGLKSQYSTSYSNPPNDKRQNLFSKLVEPAFSKTGNNRKY